MCYIILCYIIIKAHISVAERIQTILFKSIWIDQSTFKRSEASKNLAERPSPAVLIRSFIDEGNPMTCHLQENQYNETQQNLSETNYQKLNSRKYIWLGNYRKKKKIVFNIQGNETYLFDRFLVVYWIYDAYNISLCQERKRWIKQHN